MGSTGAEFRKVVIAGGSGNLGVFLTKAFLDRKDEFTVSILTRQESASKPQVLELQKSGAHVLMYGDSTPEAIAEVLKGADTEVIVSAISLPSLAFEQTLIRAAKLAGVRRFVPSSWGIDMDTAKTRIGMHTPKQESRKVLLESGLEYTFYYTGWWPDTTIDDVIGSWTGFTWRSGRVSVPGDGNANVSWTTRTDVGKFVAASINDPRTRNTVVKVCGDVKTHNEIIALFEKHGKKLEVTYIPVSELEQAISANPNPRFTWVQQLQLVLAAGDGYLRPPYDSANYPEITPTAVADVVKGLLLG